jgi:hypothetical protein
MNHFYIFIRKAVIQDVLSNKTAPAAVFAMIISLQKTKENCWNMHLDNGSVPYKSRDTALV